MSQKKASFKGDAHHATLVIEAKRDTPILKHLQVVITPAPAKNLSDSGSLQLPKNDESNVWESTPAIGLLSSESPDSVAAWRGRKRPSLYGKPFLTCDVASRELVLPEPIYMMWPKWMNMESVAVSHQVSETDVQQGEKSSHATTSGSFLARGGHLKKRSVTEHQNDKMTNRVPMSSFSPTRYPQNNSKEPVSRHPPTSEDMGKP